MYNKPNIIHNPPPPDAGATGRRPPRVVDEWREHLRRGAEVRGLEIEH